MWLATDAPGGGGWCGTAVVLVGKRASFGPPVAVAPYAMK